MSISAEEIRERIHTQPMTGLQILVVFLCWMINAFDGFDVLAIAFTAPAITEEWGLSPGQIGIVFSSGLAGMMLGSFFLAPIADHIGRRKTILIFLAVITVGLLATAYVKEVTTLLVTRLITGLGVGGMLASANSMVAEYSSDRRKDLTVNIYSLGYSIGVIGGGIISVFLIGNYGWQSVYIFGAAASAILWVLLFFLMPESIDFLLLRHPRDVLNKLNKILAKMKYPVLEQVPLKPEKITRAKESVALLFTGERLYSTLALWSCFFICFFTLYFFLNWLPSILTTAGLSISRGISANIFYSIGGVIGMLILGYFSAHFGLVRLLKVFFLGCSVFTVALAMAGTHLTLVLIVSTAIGFFTYGFVGGLYASAARLYPVEARTTGIGWAIGIGRFGSIVSPALAGFLYNTGWSNFNVYILYTLPPLLAVVLLFALKVPEYKKISI